MKTLFVSKRTHFLALGSCHRVCSYVDRFAHQFVSRRFGSDRFVFDRCSSHLTASPDSTSMLFSCPAPHLMSPFRSHLHHRFSSHRSASSPSLRSASIRIDLIDGIDPHRPASISSSPLHLIVSSYRLLCFLMGVFVWSCGRALAFVCLSRVLVGVPNICHLVGVPRPSSPRDSQPPHATGSTCAVA